MTESYNGYLTTAYSLENRESSQKMLIAEGTNEDVLERTASVAEKLGDGAETQVTRVYRLRVPNLPLSENLVVLPKPQPYEGYEPPRVKISARRVSPQTT